MRPSASILSSLRQTIDSVMGDYPDLRHEFISRGGDFEVGAYAGQRSLGTVSLDESGDYSEFIRRVRALCDTARTGGLAVAAVGKWRKWGRA